MENNHSSSGPQVEKAERIPNGLIYTELANLIA